MNKVKHFINRYPHMDSNRIIKKITSYKVVSFDIFDTLIKRDVYSASDVFDLAERYYNLDCNESIYNFKENRIEAERTSRMACYSEEVTLDDIYNKLEESYGVEITHKLKECELKVEIETCCRNQIIGDVYDYCLKNKKKIILVSDMYLPESVIRQMLEKTGYQGYDSLYLSSTIGYQKKSGKLFSYVLNREKITGSEIIHIGDHKRDDFVVAKKCGLATVSIAKNMRNTRYLDSGSTIDQGIIYSFINNRLLRIENRNEQIGYEVYGPLLNMFIKWLGAQLDDTSSVFFMARDCYVVKEAFEKLYGDNNFHSIYFMGSRKSLIVPSICKDSSICNIQKMIKSEPAQMTLNGLLKNIGLDLDNYRDDLEKANLSIDEVIYRDHLDENSKFVNFWNTIQQDVVVNSQTEKYDFDKYFQSLNSKKKIQIVDIGWRCTMQYCLRNLLPEDYTIEGFYLGVREDALVPENVSKGYYLNHELDEKKKIFLASMTALIEIFFSAPYGSIIGYDFEGIPIYDEYECEKYPKATDLVKDIQQGALQFVQDFSESWISRVFNPEDEMMFSGLKQLGVNPETEELKSFGQFPFKMGTGVVKAADPDKLSRYIFRPKKLLYDFSNSNWKVGFLKKLFRIRLPYYKIFEIIYKHKG